MAENKTTEMVQENNTPGNVRVSQAAEQKGSAFAVPDAKWFIAECKPTRERTIREMLTKAGYEVYVVSQKEKHRYKSGNTRIVEHVILPGRIFVHTEERSLVNILTSYSAVYRFQINRAATAGKFGVKPFAFVPSADMERLMAFLEKSANPVTITDEELKLGQKVKVMYGPLAGFEGSFYRKGSATYMVIMVNMGHNHYAQTEISADDIRVINE